MSGIEHRPHDRLQQALYIFPRAIIPPGFQEGVSGEDQVGLPACFIGGTGKAHNQRDIFEGFDEFPRRGEMKEGIGPVDQQQLNLSL